MKKFKLKNEKGITLVALVVTIVVLIILAVISINAVFGEDGIIKRAEEARDTQLRGEQNDLDALESLDSQISELIGQESSGETGKRLVDMFNAALAANCEGGENCTDKENHLHVGDYLNYENPTSGSVTVAGTVTGMQDAVDDEYDMVYRNLTEDDINQTYTLSSTKNNVKWRVMGIDKKTGGIKLVADNVLEKDVTKGKYTDLCVYGAKSYLNSITVTDEETKEGFLDNICSMYANTKYGIGTVARSITAEDINEMIGITEADISSYDEYQTEYEKNYGSRYVFQDYQFKPEDWEKANEDGEVTEDEIPNEITGIVDGYCYYAATTEESDSCTKRISDVEYDLIRTIEKPYFLASRGAVALKYAGCAAFGLGCVDQISYGERLMICSYETNVVYFYSDGTEYCVEHSVRPVVCLESGVTVNDLQVYMPDQGE